MEKINIQEFMERLKNKREIEQQQTPNSEAAKKFLERIHQRLEEIKQNASEKKD